MGKKAYLNDLNAPAQDQNMYTFLNDNDSVEFFCKNWNAGWNDAHKKSMQEWEIKNLGEIVS